MDSNLDTIHLLAVCHAHFVAGWEKAQLYNFIPKICQNETTQNCTDYYRELTLPAHQPVLTLVKRSLAGPKSFLPINKALRVGDATTHHPFLGAINYLMVYNGVSYSLCLMFLFCFVLFCLLLSFHSKHEWNHM